MELCALHIGECYVPLGGALFRTNLIIPNVSSLWTHSSETVTKHTLQRQCLSFKTEVPPAVLSIRWIMFDSFTFNTPIPCDHGETTFF